MGLCNIPDIFQEKMLKLMYDLEYVRTYIDDLLVITNGDWACTTLVIEDSGVRAHTILVIEVNSIRE